MKTVQVALLVLVALPGNASATSRADYAALLASPRPSDAAASASAEAAIADACADPGFSKPARS